MWRTLLSPFTPDRLEDFWNVWLLVGELVAAATATWGIIWESKGYLDKRIAHRYIVLGVVFETIFTFSLFASEEAISHAQRVEIIALKKAAAPRNIEDRQSFVAPLTKVPGIPYDLTVPPVLEPGSFLINQILGGLREAGWRLQSIEGNVAKEPLSPMVVLFSVDPNSIGKPGFAIPEVSVGRNLFGIGVAIDIDLSKPDVGSAAAPLWQAFHAAGIEAHFQFHDPNLTGDAVHIIVGAKP